MEKNKSKKILVVVDMQNDFVSGALGSQKRRRLWTTS
jgi:nicotinamidase-related amidase